MNKKIIVFGSLNMDLSIETPHIPAQGETVEGQGFFTAAGGKGGNQAGACALLGGETYLMGKVGKDYFGREILDNLKKTGLHCETVTQSSRPTGTALILRTAGDNRIICDYGANHDMSFSEMEELMKKLGEPGDLFLTQFECEKEVVLESILMAKSQGMITIFNPAPAKSIPEEIYRKLDYIVVNETECAFLTGILPQENKGQYYALQFFEKKGVAVPVITLGAEGSVYLYHGEVYRCPGHVVKVADTTGAGDAYIGALASCISRGLHIHDAVAFATGASALAVQKVGALQSIPTLEETEKYIEKKKGDVK